MPAAEMPIASAATVPTIVLFNEMLILQLHLSATGRNGVAYIETSGAYSAPRSLRSETSTLLQVKIVAARRLDKTHVNPAQLNYHSEYSFARTNLEDLIRDEFRWKFR
jgi:hypothetical protein